MREIGGGRSDAAFSWLVMAERSGFENAEPVRPITLGEKILISTRLTQGQRAALRTALGRGVAESLNEEQRMKLFAAVHEGKFVEACNLLGTCPAPTEVSAALRLMVSPRDGAIEPAAVDAIHASVPSRGPAAPIVRNEAPKNGGSAANGRGTAGSPAAAPLGSTTELHQTAGAADILSGDGRTQTAAQENAGVPAMAHGANPGVAWLTVSEAVEPGDVLVADVATDAAFARGRDAADPRVVGIVGAASMSGGEAPVVIAGIAACKVDAAYGPIAAGDLLAVSPTPGHAMRSVGGAPGTIVAKALQSWTDGRGTIRVLVMLR